MKKFGILPSGEEVFEHTITNANGMSLSAINYGGIITKLIVPSKGGFFQNVVLSFNNLEDYLNDTCYIGALIGRCANRISNASFSLDGKQVHVSKNQGDNQLHGGIKGFNSAYWHIEKTETDRGEILELHYTSIDGESGYPGTMKVVVKYILTDENEVIIEYSATTDAPTIANFTQHTYFNLSGNLEPNILTHEIELYADSFLPIDEFGLPTGKIESISKLCDSKNTLQHLLESGTSQIVLANGLDHCFVVSNSNKNKLKKFAKLTSSVTDISLTVFTNQEAFQCYSGNFLQGYFEKHAGICIETQAYTNSINQPSFPSVVLLPSGKYERKTVFSFSGVICANEDV